MTYELKIVGGEIVDGTGGPQAGCCASAPRRRLA
jgi:hypothetical protein